MKRFAWLLIGTFYASSWVTPATAQPSFVRGDANVDSTINIADAVFSLSWLFVAGSPPPVTDAADTNDNGVVEISDIAYLLTYLFSIGAPPPPAPFPGAGMDTTAPNFPTGPSGAVEYELTVPNGCPNDIAVVSMLLGNNMPVEAFSARITYETADLTYLSTTELPLELLLGRAPDFFRATETAPGAVRIGALMGFIDPTGQAIPVGPSRNVVDLAFSVNPAAPLMTLSPVRFADDAASFPPAYNLASIAGQAHLPSTIDGGVFIDCTQFEFRRGDTNEDGSVTVSDAVFIVDWLFFFGTPSQCNKTGDTNADGFFDLADIVFLLNALLGGGPPIPAPYPNCGLEPTPTIFSCDAYAGGCP